MRNYPLLLLAATVLLTCGQAQADIYKYTDGNGHIFYTDHPKHKGYSRIIKSSAKIANTKQWGHKKPYIKLSERREKYASLIKRAASENRLDPKLIHAVIQAESAYNPQAVSKAGAVGLMQLMPQTAERFGVTNRRDPRQNVRGGARYLRVLLDLFKSNVRLAVAAYNAGENAVLKYGSKIPPYKETRTYVKRVMNVYGTLKSS